MGMYMVQLPSYPFKNQPKDTLWIKSCGKLHVPLKILLILLCMKPDFLQFSHELSPKHSHYNIYGRQLKSKF